VTARPHVRSLLQIAFVYNLAYLTFTGIFSLHAKEHLELASDQTGYLLAYVGVLAVIVQGGMVGRLAARYPDGQLIRVSAVIMVFALVGWGFAPQIGLSMLVLIPLAFSIGVLSTILLSVLTKAVSVDDVGSLMGLFAAITSLARTIGPAIGGALFDLIGSWAPGVFGAGLMAWFAVIGLRALAVARESASEPEREIAVTG